MRHVPTLLKRELASYFLSPMAYLILIGFQVIAWLNFWQLVDLLSDPRTALTLSGLRDPLNSYIADSPGFWIAVLIAIPALTMRIFAEERRSGTIETLLTLPITETEVVVAKWLGGVVVYLVLLIPFFIYLPFLIIYGKYPIETGPLLALFSGLLTLGMMFTAIGVFFSATTKNQIIAAISTFVALFLIILLTSLLYQQAESFNQPGLAEGLRYVSVLSQLHECGQGVLDLRYLALHLSATVLVLYVTVKVVELSRDA